MAILWLRAPVSPLEGSVALPYSKSLSNRQLVLGVQTGEGFRIDGLSEAEDTRWLLQALKQLGYTAAQQQESWTFYPPQSPPAQSKLFLGEGGTTLRFLLPWLARLPGEHLVQVAPALQRRPIIPLIEALQRAGAAIQTAPDLFPLLVRGAANWRPTYLSVDSSLSSQFLSALFLLAPHLSAGACIQELSPQPATPSYSEATRQLLLQHGWHWQATPTGWCLHIGPKKPLHFVGERDWSAASFFFGWAALVPASLRLPLRPTALQPEYRLFSTLPWPYHYTVRDDAIEVVHTAEPLPALDIDVREFPDAALVLAVVCAFASGESRLRGIATLPHKESHRLQALQTELARIGARVSWDLSELRIYPVPHPLRGEVVFESYGDHRVAMALSWWRRAAKPPSASGSPTASLSPSPATGVPWKP